MCIGDKENIAKALLKQFSFDEWDYMDEMSFCFFNNYDYAALSGFFIPVY